MRQKRFLTFFCGICAAAAALSFTYIIIPHADTDISAVPGYDYPFSNAVSDLDEAEVCSTGSTAESEDIGSLQYGSVSSRTGYYYQKLSDTQKTIYLKILEAAASPHSTSLTTPITVQMEPASNEFVDMFTTAYDSVLCDRPDLFWLYNQSSKIQYVYKNKKNEDGSYDVAFRLTNENDNYEYEKRHFEDAVKAFMSDIDQTASDYDIVLQIHDKLLDSTAYKEDTSERSDDAHDAYGALVNHEAVCDGYSLAYEYLLRQAGINSTMVYGQAGANDSLGSHAWNLVEIDGEWYEVDTTWDDATLSIDTMTDKNSITDSEKEIIEKALQDKEYTNRLRHYMFLLSTEEIENYNPEKYGDKYVYTSGGSTVMVTTKSRHIRNEKEDTGDTGDYVSYMAPIAKTSYQEQ